MRLCRLECVEQGVGSVVTLQGVITYLSRGKRSVILVELHQLCDDGSLAGSGISLASGRPTIGDCQWPDRIERL